MGTKRMLGVVPSENEIMPQCLRDHVAASANVYGDFTVCPFGKQTPHEMQLVCVEATTDFLVERLGAPDGPPALYRGCSKSLW